MGKKYLFLDRDGCLLREPPDEQIDRLEELSLLNDLIPSLLRFKNSGYSFVMITNQDGLGTPNYPQEQFELVQGKLIEILESQGIFFSEIHVCPHFPADLCSCRKPSAKMLRHFLALSDKDWDRKNSYVVGDRNVDLELARNLGIRGYKVSADPRESDQHTWPEIASLVLDQPRRGEVTRHTTETQIEVFVDLDSPTPCTISTGLGYFDHMLEQLSKHSQIGMRVSVRGDLGVDEHHTVEDTAIAIGQAIEQALGDKRGIQRFSFVIPMDESKASVTLDLSGRGYFVFKSSFKREKVGELPTELVPHFFRSLAMELKATLHMEVSGENDHHQIEALFKALARCLKIAVQKENLSDGFIPSTKGVL